VPVIFGSPRLTAAEAALGFTLREMLATFYHTRDPNLPGAQGTTRGICHRNEFMLSFVFIAYAPSSTFRLSVLSSFSQLSFCAHGGISDD